MHQLETVKIKLSQLTRKVNEELIHKIHHDIQPIVLQGHEIHGEFNGHHSVRPHLEIISLSCLSVLPHLRQRHNFLTPQPRKIVNRFPGWKDDGFIGDNFGTYYDSFGGFPIEDRVRDYLEPLNLAPANAEKLRYSNPGTAIESDIMLLEQMTSDKSITSISNLSAIIAYYPEIRNHPWSSSFSLVVGDSFIDRISFWNGRLLLESWQNEQLSSLRIPAEQLKDGDFISKLSLYIARWNWMSFYGHSEPHYITIRSHSISEDTLNDLAEKLRAATRNIVQIEKLKNETDCCPDKSLLTSQFNSISNENPHYISERTAQIDISYPMHLVDMANLPPRFRYGSWVVEEKIERHNNLSTYSNVQHWWKLPRRGGLVRLFFENLSGKITSEGYLAIAVNYQSSKIKITLPEGEDIFEAILHYENYFSPRDLRFKVFKPSRYEFSEFSDKGRYLNGVLGLFKGLNNAFNMISSSYWRGIFTELGMPKSKVPDVETKIITRLKRRLGAGDRKTYTIENDEAWSILAKIVSLEARDLRSPKSITDFKKLSSKWCENIEKLIAQNTQSSSDDEMIIRELQQNFEISLQSLCSTGIFSQGYQWACKKCGYDNWVSIDSLTLKLKCQICRSEAQAQVNFDWNFYLNGFFSESIREHGTLPLIWAIGQLNHRSKDSFFFSPPLDLYTVYPESKRTRPNAEIDLICVSDGKLIIGEVKSSERDFKDKDINSLIEAAKFLQPDFVLIACFEKNSKRLNEKINKIQNELTSFDCKVILLEPDELFEGEDYYLPAIDE